MNMTAGQHYTDFPPGNLEKLIEQAIATGLPPHVHAIGDKGNRIILDVYEKLLAKHKLMDARPSLARDPRAGRPPRRLPAVRQAEARRRDQSVPRVRRHALDGRAHRPRALAGAYAFRKLKDAGAVLIFGSDSPGTNAARYFLNPVYGLYAAVSRQTLKGNRRTAGFRISV